MIKEKSQRNIIYPKVGLKDVLRAFWQGIKPQKWLLFFLAFSIISANIVATMSPILYKQFFDIISAGGNKTTIVSQLLKMIIQIAFFIDFDLRPG